MVKTGRTKMMSEVIDGVVMPGIQGGPLMHIIAAKAVAFGEALQPSFTAYGRQILANANALARHMVARGFKLISGGTDNHLMLIDLHNKNVSGKDVEIACGTAGIVLNKNMVPFDDRSPFVTSGVRIGTAALTTRGFKEADMEFVAEKINEVVINITKNEKLESIAAEIREYCLRFPLYTDIV